MPPRLWLPRWVMSAQFVFVAPLLRALGLPAFMSRDTVNVTRAHLHYSAAKARRDLGWDHPPAAEMWDRIIRRERALIDARRGFRERLRHMPVVWEQPPQRNGAAS